MQRQIEARFDSLDAECARLERENDRLSAALAEREWRDIATAPTDGTEILAWRKDCGRFIARYTSSDAFPLTQEEIDSTDAADRTRTRLNSSHSCDTRLPSSAVTTHKQHTKPISTIT